MATAELDVIFDRMDNVVSTLVRKIALDLHANLVAKPAEGGTPVDTGWARSNWIPRVGGEPFQGTAGERPKQKIDFNAAAIGLVGSLRLVNVGGSIDYGPQQEGLKGISGFRIGFADHIFVSNNVPYIGALNAGSSRQQPAGFVERAIVKAITEDLRGTGAHEELIK